MVFTCVGLIPGSCRSIVILVPGDSASSQKKIKNYSFFLLLPYFRSTGFEYYLYYSLQMIITCLWPCLHVGHPAVDVQSCHNYCFMCPYGRYLIHGCIASFYFALCKVVCSFVVVSQPVVSVGG